VPEIILEEAPSSEADLVDIDDGQRTPDDLTVLPTDDGIDIHVQHRIGEGATAEVWQGQWGERVVAVKLFACHSDDANTQYRKELEVLQGMQQMQHPCVCALLQAGVLHNERPWIAFEHMARGSLSSFLHETDELRAAEPSLQHALLARIVMQVAEGLAYLHGCGLIHRDIKTNNVLLDAQLNAKVGDFGLSTPMGRSEYTAESGTYRTMAPEIVLRQPYDHRCDVYSYGLLLWETLHREEPFAGLMPLQAAFAVAMQQLRPTIALADDLACYAELIEACWQAEPAKRPAMDQVRAATAQYYAAASSTCA